MRGFRNQHASALFAFQDLTVREGVASQIGGAKLDAILNMAGNASVTHEVICNSNEIEQLSN